MKGKKKTICLIVLVIVLLCAAFVGGYFTNEKGLIKNETSKESAKVDDKEEPKVENLGLFDDLVVDALNSFGILSVDYGTDIKDISKKNLIKVALKGIDRDKINACSSATKTITIDELNEGLNKYVKDVKLTVEDIKAQVGETGGYLDEIYGIEIKDGKLYPMQSCDGRGPGPYYLEDKVASIGEKAEKIGDNLYVYKKVAYGSLDSENAREDSNYFPFAYYKDKTKKQLVVSDISGDGQLANYWSKFDTYKLIFEKTNNTYYFVRSEIV